jgi:outer membrane receptor protein involved in Fe transport
MNTVRLTALTILGACSLAYAKDTAPPAESDAVSLADFTITASRSLQPVAEVPARVEMVTALDLEATPGVYLTDSIKKNASVDVIQYPGGLAGIGLRGFRPEFSGTNQRVLVLIDGRPSGATNLGNLPSASIERIEILKGSSSSLYGASAMGGVVNVITRRSSGDVRGSASVGVGSYETVLGGVTVGGSHGRLDFDAALSTRTQFDNFTMGNGEERQNTSFANHSGSVRLGARISDTWRIDGRFNTFVGEDIEAPGAYTDGTSGQSSKDVRLHGGDLRLDGSIGTHAIRATLHHSRETDKRRNETAGIAPFHENTRYTTFEGVQLQDAWTIAERYTLIGGVDYERVENENLRFNASGAKVRPSSVNDRRVTTAVFADASVRFLDNRFILNGGVRYDSIDLELLATPLRPDVVPGVSTLTTTNPRAGLVFMPGAGWRLHATAGRGFVAPAANQTSGYYDETVGAQRRITRGNPNLAPESAWSYDAGIGYDQRLFSVDLTWFQIDVVDKIESVIVTNTPALRESTYVNASTATSSGLEFTFAADVGALWKAPRAQWRLSGAYTRLLDREQNLPAGTSVLRNVAEHKANITLAYTPSRALSLRTNLRWVAGMWDQDFSRGLVFTDGRGGLFEYPSFVVWDLSASYRIRESHTVSLSVDNVFDRFYYEKNDYPMAGRSFTARYAIHF